LPAGEEMADGVLLTPYVRRKRRKGGYDDEGGGRRYPRN